MITKVEFDEIATLNCPHCRKGNTPRLREDTKEWVHDTKSGGVMAHSICWSSGFRRSRFADEVK